MGNEWKRRVCERESGRETEKLDLTRIEWHTVYHVYTRSHILHAYYCYNNTYQILCQSRKRYSLRRPCVFQQAALYSLSLFVIIIDRLRLWIIVFTEDKIN